MTIQCSPADNLRRGLRPIRRLGLITIAIFFMGGGGWAALASLAYGTIAPGVISPDGSRRTVQHFEGGIIREIRVRDGDRVSRDDVLAVLEDSRARADHDSLRAKFLALLAEHSRLMAERREDKELRFDARLLVRPDDPVAQAAMAAQRALFTSRTKSLSDAKEILRQKIEELARQIEALTAENASLDEQFALITEEIEAVDFLYGKGLERKSRILDLRRTAAQIRGDKARNVAEIARAKGTVDEARLQISQLDSERREQIDGALAEIQAKIIESERQLDSAGDILARTLIKAPVDGFVMNLRFKTLGGVVRPTDPILDLVPINEKLVIDARVSSTDIDDVRVGLPADVVLSAYPLRKMHPLAAIVETVSADATLDENEAPFYQVRVVVDAEDIRQLPDGVFLYPGMPVEVMIKSGQRTMIDYLLEPILQSVRRSFSES